MQYKNHNKGKIDGIQTNNTGKVAQYANSSFFLKKDEQAKKFLKKNPIPETFWEKP